MLPSGKPKIHCEKEIADKADRQRARSPLRKLTLIKAEQARSWHHQNGIVKSRRMTNDEASCPGPPWFTEVMKAQAGAGPVDAGVHHPQPVQGRQGP